MKRVVQSANAPHPGGAYSQGVIAGDLFFTAGMGPIDPDSGKVVGSTIEEQTIAVMSNLEAILKAAGLGFEHVVRVTAHLHDVERDFPGFNQTYATFFVGDFPVRTTVGSHLMGILVEIDMIATVR